MAAFIDFKQINRHVLRRKLNQFIQRIAPAFRSLVRQSGNQVEADVLNSCGVKKGHRAIDITAAVHAASGFEFDVGKRLHTEADAIDSSAAQASAFAGSTVSGSASSVTSRNCGENVSRIASSIA